jgi:hypothetical protein
MIQLKVVKSGDKVEPQSETTAPIAVRPSENPEDLEASDDVLDGDPQSRQSLIECPLRFIQRTPLGVEQAVTLVANSFGWL